ncbi:isochorismatase family protein [Pseudonocardia sp.]|jgi:hypothetical protein|uniref:isochorismatase family protein n=1 Tax=Pseudonocardia sp. TaxID=60912 RepID=UPI002630B66E|nr:isochorismatase family protein [Pseudonocardia sp.]MCW2721753.1 hypothetical protein [Pseudonocardia sp.]
MTVRGLDRGERCALVVNECQNAMVSRAHSRDEGLAGEIETRGVIPRIAELARACRRAGVLVAHSTIVLRADGVGTTASCLLLGVLAKSGTCVEGRAGAEIHRDLARAMNTIRSSISRHWNGRRNSARPVSRPRAKKSPSGLMTEAALRRATMAPPSSAVACQ